MSSGGMLPSPMGNNQDLQVKQDIVQAINNEAETLRQGTMVKRTIGYNAAGATGTFFTATSDQTVLFINVSSTSGADTITINWADDSASTTHNIITDGAIPADSPLRVEGPFALSVDDELQFAGGDSDMDFIVTYEEQLG